MQSSLRGAVQGRATCSAQVVWHRATSVAVAGCSWRQQPQQPQRCFHVSRRAFGMFDGIKDQASACECMRAACLFRARCSSCCVRAVFSMQPLLRCSEERYDELFCSGTNPRTITWESNKTRFSRTRSLSWSSAKSTPFKISTMD